MRITRIQVPHFRVLYDIDIAFDQSLTPQVFPLGSQNGGGKSTLLQLVFILLHGFRHPDRKPFIAHLLESFFSNRTIPEIEGCLCEIDLEHAGQSINLKFEIHSLNNVRQVVESTHERLDDSDVLRVCEFSSTGGSHDLALLYTVPNFSTYSLLDKISERIYLAAPSTQVFLFLDSEAKKSVFSRGNGINNYHSALASCKENCPGLFTYDFLAVDLLINVFQQARDQDFQCAVDSVGVYGNEYRKVVNEMNSLLQGKQVRVDAALSRISFERTGERGGIELGLEELSHGELKRLSIYVWLKHQVAPGSVVLMDEVEIALHPDWQYQITTDLVEWEPRNQYVLATHSYELCEALTPAHVRELEPKLKQKENTAA